LISFENIKITDKAYGENLLKLYSLWGNLIIKVYKINDYTNPIVEQVESVRFIKNKELLFYDWLEITNELYSIDEDMWKQNIIVWHNLFCHKNNSSPGDTIRIRLKNGLIKNGFILMKNPILNNIVIVGDGNKGTKGYFRANLPARPYNTTRMVLTEFRSHFDNQY
jgi:hypothetical protein